MKTAKSLLEKAANLKPDPYLALLAWRNTPSETLSTSPVQRLFSRRTKTLLPTSNQLLKPKIPEDVNQKMKLQKAKQSMHYNRGAKEFEELRPGDVVRIQPQKTQFGKKEWTQARVEGKVDIRSYQVRTEDGRAYRRNRRHLRRTQEAMCNSEVEVLLPPRTLANPATPSACEKQLSVQPATSNVTVSNGIQQSTAPVRQADNPQVEQPVSSAQSKPASPPVMTTRSGRVVRPPIRYMNSQS